MATPTTTAVRVSLSTAVSRLPALARVAVFALAIFVAEVVLAASIVGGGRLTLLLLLFAVVIASALVFRFPMATAFLLLGLTDFIFHSGFFPSAGFGPISVRGYELVLVGLLAIAVVQPRRRSWGGLPGFALAAFLVFVAVSGMIAVGSGRANFSDAFNWGRSLGLLTIFYVVIRVFPEPEQRRTLLLGASILAAITGIVALATALGSPLGDLLKDSGSQIVREEEGVGGIQRVRLAGLSAGYALFWYVAAQVAASNGTRRLGYAVLLSGIAINIVVSFNRNMWSGLVLGLALIMVLGGPLVRSRLVTGIAVGVLGVALITAVSPSGQDRLIDPVVKRGSTIINPGEISREGSFRDREVETTTAWDTAKQNLLLGVGPGAEFGIWREQQVGPNSSVRIPRLFLHNQYLYLLLIGGIPALTAFMIFLGVPIKRAIRRRPRDLSIVSCAIGILLIMVSATVAIYFTAEDMAVMLGLLTGLIVSDSEGRAADGLDSGLAA